MEWGHISGGAQETSLGEGIMLRGGEMGEILAGGNLKRVASLRAETTPEVCMSSSFKIFFGEEVYT